jgi:nucleolar protein 9
MKDKIAESLIEHEYTLQSSHFGHYFLRKVNLPLYKRDKREWRDRQAREVGGTPAELHAQAAKQELLQKQQQAQQAEKQESQATPAEPIEAANNEGDGKKRKDRKRKKEKVDEIDELFNTVKRGKVDGGAAAVPSRPALQQRTENQVEESILKALKGASSETKHT